MSYQWKYVAAAGEHRWVMKRNCALSPAELGCWFGSLGLVALALAGFFTLLGAWPIMLFAVVVNVALVASFVWWSRHAADYEQIVFADGVLRVETSSGERLQRIERCSHWLRIEYGGDRRERIRIVAPGGAVEVGIFVPGDRRAALVQELKGAFASQPAIGSAPG